MSLTIDEKTNTQKKKIPLVIQSLIQMVILLVLSLIGLFIMLIILFIVIRNMPGSPYMSVSWELRGQTQAEYLEWLNNRYGLDKPVISQFFIFLWNLISGDTGLSLSVHRGATVEYLIERAYPRSFELNFLSFGFSLLLGAIFGILAFVFKDKWFGLIPQAIKRLNWAIPVVGLALLLQLLFSFKLGWLPAGRYFDATLEEIPAITNFRLIDCLLAGRSDYYWDTVRHLILPIICKGFLMFSFIVCLTYSIIDFFKSPNEMHFLSGKIGFYLSFILATDILIETAFTLHGIGWLIVTSINGVDIDVTSAAIYSILLTFFIINLSINFLLHIIRIIKELVNKTNLDEEIIEPTISSVATLETNLEPTMDNSAFIIDDNEENKKSMGKEIFMNLRRKLFNPLTILGILTILLVLIFAIFAKWISPYDFALVEVGDKSTLPYEAPSNAHIFGVTKFGRDVFSRCLYGMQTAVKVGIISTLIGMPLGVIMGTFSAFFGKWVKYIIDTINGIVLFLPGILFAFFIIAILGSEISYFYWILGLVNLPIATLFTQQAISYEMKRGDIKSFKFSKINGRKILIRLPNIILSIIGVGCLITGLVILTFESVNFLGFGDPNAITLGADVNIAQRQIEYAPWASLWPISWIYITVLGFIMLGIGLKEE